MTHTRWMSSPPVLADSSANDAESATAMGVAVNATLAVTTADA